jgi:hypothetical protein
VPVKKKKSSNSPPFKDLEGSQGFAKYETR